MTSITEKLEVIFAIVGLVAAVIFVLRSGWQPAAKMISTLFGGMLLLMFFQMFSRGIVTQEQAAMVLLFGIGGLVILSVLAIRRWGTSWYPWAIAGTTLIVAALMIWTFNATSRSGVVPPLAPSSMGGASAPSATAPAASTSTSSPVARSAPRSSSRRSRASGPDLSDCPRLSYESKRALGCP